jgi:hypothetical protein
MLDEMAVYAACEAPDRSAIEPGRSPISANPGSSGA